MYDVHLKQVGACLDRNGLRPARYLVTRDGMVCMMSETGVVPVDECDIVEKVTTAVVYTLPKSYVILYVHRIVCFVIAGAGAHR
jgi:Glutamine amidotransferases class-II